MTFQGHNFRSALAGACALAALAATLPAGTAGAASTTGKPGAGLSALIKAAHARSTAAASTTTTAPATTTQAPSTTTTAPASGAQPGTVAPGSTPTAATPTASVPATTVPPATTTLPSTTAPAATTPSGTTSPGSPTTVIGVAHKPTSSSRLSTGALALAILGALLALGCAVWVVGRWMALEPRWTISMMHSLREAGYHASATWAEFSDWAKLGR